MGRPISSCSTSGLPDIDGFAVLAEMRGIDQGTPVIMLTARGDVPSRVRGLDLGADDYLAKPFDFDELVARIRAQLRHSRQPQASVLECGDLHLDLKTRKAHRGDRTSDLTSREFALLEFLMRHEGQVLSRSQILGSVWGYGFDPQSNVVDVYVGYLRGKLDRAGEDTIIETVRGGGYRLRCRMTRKGVTPPLRLPLRRGEAAADAVVGLRGGDHRGRRGGRDVRHPVPAASRTSSTRAWPSSRPDTRK